MVAYRVDGGRLFYVEHECKGAKRDNPNERHVEDKEIVNPVYVVRMYYTGDLEATLCSPNDFAYITDGVQSGSREGYINCPLCGSPGRIVFNDEKLIEMRESYGRSEAPESLYR